MSSKEIEVGDNASQSNERLDEPMQAEAQDPWAIVLSEGNMKCTTESSVINEDGASGQHSGMEAASRLQFDSVYAHEYNRSPCHTENNKEHEQCKVGHLGFRIDLNALDTLNTVEHCPFYPFKGLEQVKSTDVSECGSTTGPIEENEPLKKWKEMKQNGFISPSPGGILVPQQRGRPPRKKKDDVLRKKLECTRRGQSYQAKREPVNREKVKRDQVKRFTKIAAPTGLLSGLNPGIINHVRNSKQVHSIIEAIVRSERDDTRTQTRTSDQMIRTDKELNDRLNKHSFIHYSTITQFSTKTSVSRPTKGHVDVRSEMDTVAPSGRKDSTNSQLTTGHEDDGLTLNLSSATTSVYNDAESGSADAIMANQDNFDSVTLTAATVASQWLELLQLDIKGRLAALRASKKRLRNAIRNELSYLLSTNDVSNQENNPSVLHSEDGNSSKAVSEIHVARWKSLFNQMDIALSEEGKHLEVWLKQVQDMQLHCEHGLRYVLSDSLQLVGSSDDSSKTEKSDSLEMELAVRAAAASIYSTSNLIMKTENVSCF